MLAAVYLVTLAAAGILVVTRCMPHAPAMVRLAAGPIVGGIATTWVTFMVAFLGSYATGESLFVGIVVAILVNIAVIAFLARTFRPEQYRLFPLEIVLIGLALIFCFWMMDQRLKVDTAHDDRPVVVSSNTWGDTALHFSLARSFSYGENYPPEYPFYANEPIIYHFGYDFFAGALEEGGMGLHWAFNLPGALGFAAMMMLMFALARFLFSGYGGGSTHPGSLRNFGVWTGLVATCLLISNASFAFIRYFEQFDSIGEALKPVHWFEEHNRYLALGPYNVGQGVDKISLFNTLNVYLTQTHLIIAMALVLFVAFGLIQPLREGRWLTPARGALLGVAFGLGFWLNGVLYMAAGIFFGTLLVVFAGFAAWRHAERVLREDETASAFAEFRLLFWRRMKRAAWFIVPGVLLAVPQGIWLSGGPGAEGTLSTHIGYLVCSSEEASCWSNRGIDPLNPRHWVDFAEYWWLNMGLTIPLIALAMIWGSNSDRKIFLAAVAVFIWGSTVQIGRDLGGFNHKTFNLWGNVTNVFVAFALVGLWNVSSERIRVFGAQFSGRIVSWTAKAVVPVVFFFLVLSGLLDFMTIKNDFKVAVFGDRPIEFVDETLPRDSVVLIAWGDLYTTPTLAGRLVYLGYDPWAASSGYDAEIRKQKAGQMFGATDKETACRMLLEEEIDYVQMGPDERDKAGQINLNEGLYVANFTPVGSIEGPRGTTTYYDVAASCDAAAVAAP